MLEHHLNCAQSVISTYCEEFGLDRNLGFKVAMARTGKTCGAVTGVYMILGLSQRINENNARESIERTYKLIRDFNREFKALRGSLDCKDLIKFDLALPEQQAEARDKHIFVTVCPDIVLLLPRTSLRVAEIVEEVVDKVEAATVTVVGPAT